MEIIYPENLPTATVSSENKIHTVTKENDEISLPKGDVRLDENLGGYYVDLSESMIHYTSGIFGEFDEKGVPMVGWGKEACYYPTTIAQYGFILNERWRRDNSLTDYLEKMNACLERLEIIKEDFRGTNVWRQSKADSHYHLKPNWASAMTQGEVISFYLRMAQINDDKNLVQTAIKAYEFMKFDVSEGGVRRTDADGNLWFEEYPTEQPSLVLNGFIYALFGLYDLYRVTKSEAVKKDIDACVKTLRENIEKYDTGYWSLYDQMHKELVKYYYQKNVHTPQLEALYDLTGEEIFDRIAKKWRGYVSPFNFALVQIMYRVSPRMKKLKSLLKK